jgi:hypothetical protein
MAAGCDWTQRMNAEDSLMIQGVAFCASAADTLAPGKCFT